MICVLSNLVKQPSTMFIAVPGCILEGKAAPTGTASHFACCRIRLSASVLYLNKVTNSIAQKVPPNEGERDFVAACKYVCTSQVPRLDRVSFN